MGRRQQRGDELVPEAHDLVRAHVAADHPVGEPRLERLVDDAPAVFEIPSAAHQKIIEHDSAWLAAATRLQHRHGAAGRAGFDLPNALTAIAANGGAALALLENEAPDLLEIRATLDDIVVDSHRASEVLDGIRSLFRAVERERHQIDLNEMTLEVL